MKISEIVDLDETELDEMATPRQSDLGKKYYHGTNEHGIQGIISNGIKPPDLTARKGNLKPGQGKVYITSHLRYAIIYAIGGDMLGYDYNNNYGSAVSRKSIFDMADNIAALKLGLIDVASKNIKQINDGKMFSINVHADKNYVEFRSMGSDYLDHYDAIANTILRYVRAYHLACHPDEEKQEYYKKMYKLIDSSSTNVSSDTIALFARYVTSNEKIDKSELAQEIKELTKSTNRTELKKDIKDMSATRPGINRIQADQAEIKDTAISKLKSKLNIAK